MSTAHLIRESKTHDAAEQRDGQLHARLLNLLKLGSPEQFAAALRTGALHDHVAAVIHGARQELERESGDGISEGLLSTLLTRCADTSSGPLAEARWLRETFGVDPELWTERLHAHLKAWGPEGYEAARTAGHLNSHVNRVVKLAERALIENEEAGVRASTAWFRAARVLRAKATPIEPPPTHIVEKALERHFLTVSDLEALLDWMAVCDPASSESLKWELVRAVTTYPDFGKLLPHPIFKQRFGRDAMYWWLLGACRFAQGEVAEATEHFRRLVKDFPSSVAFGCLANCLRAAERYREAMDILVDGMALYPDNEWLRLLASGNAFVLGDAALSEKAFAPVREKYFRDYPRKAYVESRAAELDIAIAQNKLYRDTEVDVYDDQFTRNTWWNYWYHFNGFTQFQHAEGTLGEIVPDNLQQVFERLPRKPRRLVELGTMCGEMLYRTARANPDMSFVGVDRSAIVKELNEAAYTLDNISFEARDILEYFNSGASFEDAMLFHVRTSPFLYPAFLGEVYRRCANVGFRYIALIEVFALSYRKQRFQTFDEMEQPAEIRGGGLIHHNYPRALREAGFKVIQQKILPPSLLLAGMDSSVLIVAERED